MFLLLTLNMCHTCVFIVDFEQVNVSYDVKTLQPNVTAQKMKFSIKDFFSKYDQIRRKL